MRQHLITVFLTVTVLAGIAEAGLIVVPGANLAVEGSTSNGYPFNLASFPPTSMRYQQVYDASEFGLVPLTITSIFFRADIGDPAFTENLVGLVVRLSTTSLGPDALTSSFSGNAGTDETTVFSGALTLSSVGNISNPSPFDIEIPLTTPFTYDPTAGHLLLDIYNPNDSSTVFFDAVSSGGDSISRAYTFSNDPLGDVADQVNTLGLVTAFEATPVPEPGTWLLFGAGLLGVATLRRRSLRRES